MSCFFVLFCVLFSAQNKLTTKATKNESDACGNGRTSQGQGRTLLVNSQMTNLVHVDVTTESSGNCSLNSEEEAQLMETESSDNVVLTEEKGSSKEAIAEIDEPSDNEAAITEVYEVMSSPLQDEDQDLNPANDGIGFEQFLRKNEADSGSSDVSEPNSLHLDPLTPSEVLEHEATEILQKGTVNVCLQTGSNGEKAEDSNDSQTNGSMAVPAEKESEAVL